MGNVIKIAFRNLRRYQRRTLLTLSLITLRWGGGCCSSWPCPGRSSR